MLIFNKEELAEYIVRNLDDPNNNIDRVMEKVEKYCNLQVALKQAELFVIIAKYIGYDTEDILFSSTPKEFVLNSLKEFLDSKKK